MTEPRLKWTGTDETNRFHDEERGRIYWASERPLRVPEDAVEEYLEQDGWEEPPDDEDVQRFPGEDSESVRDARAREQQEQNEQDNGEDVRAAPATETDATDGDADTQADPAERGAGAGEGEDEDGDFDADSFVDDDWREVERQIQSGDYDEYLGAIERAERNRDGQPREASVLGAIKDRRNAPMANTDTDSDSETAEVESDETADDRAE